MKASTKTTLTALLDTQNNVHYINPALVTQMRLTGGTIGNESVVEVELSSGSVIHAIGFGSGLTAVENCMDQLNIEFP